MADYDYETSWTFRKPNHFWKLLNVQMDLQDLNDADYKLMFFSNIPDDFNDAIDSNGCLNTSAVTLIDSNYYTQTPFQLGIEYLDNGENGFKLYLNSASVTHIPITTPFYCKAIALVKEEGTHTGQNYVVAYSRLTTPVYCVDDISLQAYCEFVGHESCRSV